ncbi:MAG: hypothetical protein C1943_13620 [Halochromatium sp.]|nr:hypothetical protein [Halochromatium sp.]
MDLVRELAGIYEYEILEMDLCKIDSLISILFPLMEPWYLHYRILRNRLRKIAAFDAFASSFLYIDIDCAILRSFDDLFTAIDDEHIDIVAIQRIHQKHLDKVFRSCVVKFDWYSQVPLVPTSFFISKNGVLSVDDICLTIDKFREEYINARFESIIDQPLLNFVWAKLGLHVSTLDECGVFAKSLHLGFEDAPPRNLNEIFSSARDQHLFMVHWPGHSKEKKDFLLKEVWDYYFVRGIQRIQAKKGLAERIKSCNYQGILSELNRINGFDQK